MKKQLLFIGLVFICALWIGSCSSSDEEPKKDCTAAPVVSAGSDLTGFGNETLSLYGTTDKAQGTWTIIEGTGGTIVAGSPATFTGNPGNYKLKWEATNECGTTSDEMSLTIKACGSQTLSEFVDNIHWIEQSCFRIETTNFKIYTDPNSITVQDVADIIVITHPHPDHYSVEALNLLAGPKTILIAPQEVNYTGSLGQRVVLTPGQELNAFGDCVNIKAVPAYNINKTQFHAKASNWVGYLITVDGITTYITGDTERIPEMKDITTDIIMLPLGQTYTFDSVEDAVEAAKDVQAKIAIPMHFGLYEGTTQDAQKFKDLLDGVIPVVIKEKLE